MSASNDTAQPATASTEITVVTGERHCVVGNAKDVERTILDAARGSIMQLAWFIEANTRDDLAINPRYVVALRSESE